MVASVAGGALQAFVSGQQHYMQMQQGNMSYQMQQQPYGNMGGGYADPGQNYGGMPAGYSGYGPQPSCGGGYSGN